MGLSIASTTTYWVSIRISLSCQLGLSFDGRNDEPEIEERFAISVPWNQYGSPALIYSAGTLI